MRSYTVDVSAVKIKINSQIFTLQKSDGEAYKMVIEYLDCIQKADKTKSSYIEALIAEGCTLIDHLIGSGACYSIFGETPISLGHVVALCAQIGGGCAQAYQKYLKEEYLDCLEGLNESI